MASPERKEKLSNRCKEWHKNKTPEQEAIRRQKISEKSKLQWKNGNKGYHPNKILAYNHSRRTFPEMIMANALRKNKIKFNEQQHVGKFFPDFVIKNIIVEVDGEKWHTDKQYKYNRDRYLRRRGYHILHFSATAVIHKTQNCITIILNKIEKVKIKC
jgi:very-short-patch-repair endonuclease